MSEQAHFGLVVRWTVEAPDDIPTTVGRVADAVRTALLANGVMQEELDSDLWLCTDVARVRLDAFIESEF